MPEHQSFETLKAEVALATKALAESTRAVEETRKELATTREADAASRKALEERLAKQEADLTKLNKEHDDIIVQLQNPEGNTPGVNPEDVRGRAAARRAYGKFLRNLNERGVDGLLNGMTEEEKLHVLTVKAASAQEKRSIYVGNDEMGGFLVSPVITQQMIAQLVQVSPVRQFANVMSIGSGYELVMPKEKGQITASWTGERATRTDGTPSGGMWDQVRIPAHGQSALVPVSFQMIDDSFLNIEGFVEMRVNRQFQRGEGIAFLTGDGNNKPKGLNVNADVAIIQAAASGGANPGSFTPDEVQDLLAALPTEYALNATSLMSRATVAAMRKMKDKQDRPLDLVQRDALAKIRSIMLDGYPVGEMPNMASWGTASADVLGFGDLKEAYTIVDRAVMTIIRDPYSAKDTGMVELLYTRRVGGDVVNPAAYKKLRASAS